MAGHRCNRMGAGFRFKHLACGLVVLAALGLLIGCAGEDAEAPVEVASAPVVEEIAPPPMVPGSLFVLELSEELSSPPVPGWSPWHRVLPALPEDDLLGALKADGAGEETQAQVQAWLAGQAASSEDALVIRWELSWGEGGSSGTARFWDSCSLPCSVADRLAYAADQHPADPVGSPEALFGLRPGAQSMTVEARDEGLHLVLGSRSFDLNWPPQSWTGLQASALLKLPVLSANGNDQEDVEVSVSRRISMTVAARRPLEVKELRDKAPGEAEPLPSLADSKAAPLRLRAVEGVVEYWDWEGAKEFEGGFSVRPDPEDEGMFIERGEARVRWTPTARQAGEGETNFMTYNVKRGPNEGGLSPFPNGAEVLASSALFDGKLRVASRGTTSALARTEEVSDAFTAFRAILPLHEDHPDGTVVFLSPAPTFVHRGGPGGGAWSYSVSETEGERESLAWLWAHLALGPSAQYRTPEVHDWLLWARAQLLKEPDPSLWAAVFAAGGPDVLKIWEARLRDPERAGRAGAAAFIGYVRQQLPSLADKLIRSAARRRLTLMPKLVADAGSVQAELVGAAPGVVSAFVLSGEAFVPGTTLQWGLAPASGDPAGASEVTAGVTVPPSSAEEEEAEVFWSLVLVEGSDWDWANADDEGRGLLVARLFPDEGFRSWKMGAEAPSERLELDGPKVAIASLWSRRPQKLHIRWEVEVPAAEEGVPEDEDSPEGPQGGG